MVLLMAIPSVVGRTTTSTIRVTSKVMAWEADQILTLLEKAVGRHIAVNHGVFFW